ncbi:sigma-54-dependent Fis family transcriptional regulator [Peribacillus frigoritolerans]|uniref:sigma-54-dependent Fis family transcriptional regulator n=1 Tax=Peribacillus frigoritolerans TaxID=450367 RepID=UPI003517EF1C
MAGFNLTTNQKRVRKSWENFINDGVVDNQLSHYITQSWIYSKQQNIDPFISSHPVDYNSYENYVNNNNLFLSTADETIEQLKNYLESSSSIIEYFNSDAMLLKVFGDHSLRKRLEMIGIAPGAIANQQIIGTNAISLALNHDRPIFVSGAEHFCALFHDISCFAIPIHNNKTNKIIGVLDITGPQEIFTPHTFGLVQASVYAIEERLEKHYLKQESTLIDYYISQLSQGANSILAINKDEQIIRCSEQALPLLGKSLQQEPTRNLVKVLGLLNLKKYMKTNEPEIEFYDTFPNGLEIRIILKRVWDNGEFIGWILKMYPIGRKADKLIQKKASSFDELIGSSPFFQKAIQKAKQVATSQPNILILGETGTGKEMFARAIHQKSERKTKPFVAVNCGAIPKELIGSELFGFEDGAFSGAKKGGQKGKFELANKGTIFLDEVGELPLEHQVYLLRVLQEKEFYRLGGKNPIPTDVRVIAATNVDLLEAVSKKQFREDLYFRLNVVNLRLPTLSERGKDDIIQLVNYFLTLYNHQEQKNVSLTKEALEYLGTYPWRGNVRELENNIYRLVVLATQDTIALEGVLDMLDDDKHTVMPTENKGGLRTIDEIERKEILRVLHYYNGNLTKTAKELQISRATLYRKMEKYSITKGQVIQ